MILGWLWKGNIHWPVFHIFGSSRPRPTNLVRLSWRICVVPCSSVVVHVRVGLLPRYYAVTCLQTWKYKRVPWLTREAKHPVSFLHLSRVLTLLLCIIHLSHRPLQNFRPNDRIFTGDKIHWFGFSFIQLLLTFIAKGVFDNGRKSSIIWAWNRLLAHIIYVTGSQLRIALTAVMSQIFHTILSMALNSLLTSGPLTKPSNLNGVSLPWRHYATHIFQLSWRQALAIKKNLVSMCNTIPIFHKDTGRLDSHSEVHKFHQEDFIPRGSWSNCINDWFDA